MKTPPAPHVLQLIDGLNVGGAEVLLRDLTRGLRARGYRVSVGYSTPGPLAAEIAAAGIPLTRLPRLGRVDPLLLLGMLRLMRHDPPQVVHTHLFKSDFHGRLAARLSRVPVVVSTLHNSDAWARQPLLGRLYGLTARLADCNIAVAEEVRQYHLQHSHIPAEKVITIENGVDVGRFEVPAAAGLAVRQELGILPETPILGIIGRLAPQKDHATFLNAAALILHQLPTACFLVVGDGPLRADLHAQAQALGLEHALIFTGLRSDIPAILNALDLLVFSSRWEGLPVTLLEGMAAARPVVGSAVDGILGVVIPGVTAQIVPPGEPQALAQACLELFRDPERMRRMGAAGKQRVQERYSLEAMIDRTCQVYESWLARRSKGEQRNA